MLHPESVFLFIDTTGPFCRTTLFNNITSIKEKISLIGKGHAESLAVQFSDLCTESKISYQNIKSIFVNIGPGSFTGIRVGVAFARSLAFALECDIFGINALEALAIDSLNLEPKTIILALIPAFAGHFYKQIFDEYYKALDKASLIGQKELEQLIQSYHKPPSKKLFISEQNKIRSPLAACNITHNFREHISIASIVKIIKKYPLFKHEALPLYIRDAI